MKIIYPVRITKQIKKIDKLMEQHQKYIIEASTTPQEAVRNIVNSSYSQALIQLKSDLYRVEYITKR